MKNLEIINSDYYFKNYQRTLYLKVVFFVFISAFIINPSFPQSTKLLNNLSEAEKFYHAKDYDSSIKILEKNISLSINTEDWVSLVESHLLLAQNYNRKKDFQERLKSAENALQAVKKHVPIVDTLFAKALKEKGDSFIRLASYDSSVYYLREAQTVFRKIENWEQAAACGVGIGSNLYRSRKYAKADTVLRNVQKLIEDKIDPLPSIYGVVLNLLGAIHSRTGDYEKYLNNALKSVRFRESITSSGQRLTFAYNNLGLAYFKRADYDKALQILERAELNASKGKEMDVGSLMNIYNNLLLIHLRKKNYTEALSYGNIGLKLISNSKVKSSSASSSIFYNNLGLTYLELGQNDEAIFHFKKAYEINPNSPQTLSNLGYYYYKSDMLDSALAYFEKAIIDFDKHDYSSTAKVHRYMGEISSIKNNDSTALAHFQKSLSLLARNFYPRSNYENPELKHIRSKRELLRTLSSKAKHLLKKKETYKESINTLFTAVSLVDSMSSIHKAEGSRLFLISEAMPLFESTIEALFTLYDETKDGTIPDSIFEIMEKGKSTSLIDALQVKNANHIGGVPIDLIQQEKQLQIDISFYESEEYLALEKKDSLNAALYKAYKLEKINDLDRLTEKLQSDYPKYFNSRRQYLKSNLSKVQKDLPKGELLVEYYLGKHNTYAIGVSRSKIMIKKLGKTSAINEVSAKFLKAVKNIDFFMQSNEIAYKTLTKAGHELYQRLILPFLEENPDVEKLHIIPDQLLNYIPFEAFLSKKVDQKENTDLIGLPYLINSLSVRYSYSFFIPESKSVKRHSNRLLAMAPFSQTELKNTAKEVNQISEFFEGDHYMGASGTKEMFLENSGNYQILHLATHASSDTENPALSSLRFSSSSSNSANNDRVYAYELQNMELQADLAVLSACETGVGSFVNGEGVMSLARGFAYAGVPSVLLSLWKVDDQSSTQLITNFYRSLSNKEDKATALRNAKLSYLKGTDQLHAHPYFWSQFVLIGDTQKLTAKKADVTTLLISLILLTLVITLVVYTRSKSVKL